MKRLHPMVLSAIALLIACGDGDDERGRTGGTDSSLSDAGTDGSNRPDGSGSSSQDGGGTPQEHDELLIQTKCEATSPCYEEFGTLDELVAECVTVGETEFRASRNHSEACLEATRANYQCLSNLTCEELEQQYADDPTGMVEKPCDQDWSVCS